jgi:hypothetical protein
MVNLSLEREKEILEEHRLKQIEKEKINTEYQKMQEDQKAKQIAFWEKINTPKIIKTDVPHKCVCCNATIPASTKAVLKAKLKNVSGSGWNGQFLSEYTCLVCANQIKKAEL